MTLGDQATRLLRLIDPESSHRLAMRAMRKWNFRAPPETRDPRLEVQALGITFRNPIGLAAGLDKNAEAADEMLALGFGFAELGTVTPLPQAGNPTPRLFRLTADGALINRLGFNNEGHEAMLERLDSRGAGAGIVGVNIGANRDSDDRMFDYVAGVRLFAPLVAYLTINVSSPNTPGLRELQDAANLRELLARVGEARAAAAEECGRRTPLLLKIAPDLTDLALGALVEIARNAGMDGLIVANTTLARRSLKSRRHVQEQGGLSGRPLLEPSTAMLARIREIVGRELVLVGVGGVDSAASAWSKIAAGADLVQLYTGLVFQGPSLPGRIAAGLVKRLEERNIADINDVRGIETARWAAAWSHYA